LNYRIIVTPTAEAEAMDAFRWYAERSMEAAEKWYAGLYRALDSLAEKPTRCPISQDDTVSLGCEVRLLLYGKRRGVYRILFSISDDAVWILRIIHGARQPRRS
jgi:plasmid stabilization system protein ParE